jgi:peptidoglycan hydrolase-like protein with peptidoglycan-binding domain
MRRAILFFCLIWIATGTAVRADERVRQVQEELRKRNLYFGNVDGQVSPELAGALKRYQARKGFQVTGTVDEETSASLRIPAAVVSSKSPQSWPDTPVLRSDAARALSEPQRIALEKQAELNPDPSPSPVPPAESPPPSQDLTPDRVKKFVEDYLRDAETQDVPAQVKYYAFPVQYFDHGTVEQAFVAKDTGNYVKRWPDRKYVLAGPVNFFAAGKEMETIVEFPIAFTVRNKKHAVSGRTQNFWTVRPEGEDLKIVAIREQRLRE